MAITFLEKRKRLRYLIPIFGLVILITTFVIWRGFFTKAKPPPEEVFRKPAKQIEIDFQALKSPLLEELTPFEEIPPFEEEIGRENPFVPY